MKKKEYPPYPESHWTKETANMALVKIKTNTLKSLQQEPTLKMGSDGPKWDHTAYPAASEVAYEFDLQFQTEWDLVHVDYDPEAEFHVISLGYLFEIGPKMFLTKVPSPVSILPWFQTAAELEAYCKLHLGQFRSLLISTLPAERLEALRSLIREIEGVPNHY